MNARVPLFDGGGELRDALAKAARPASTTPERGAPALRLLDSQERWEIERQARALRAQAIADLFGRFFRWIERALWRAQQRDLERYLSQSTSHADLERRMRELERGSLR